MFLEESIGLANIDFKDLPAHQVLAEIDTARQELIGRYMTGLNALRKTLSEETGCPTNGNPNCSAIILGVLIREQHKLGLLDPSPVAPYSGYNIFTLVSRARQFPNPRPQERYCSCNIQKRLNPILEGIEYSISKYNLTA
ncbi:hypothetical protein FPOAC2_00302 [Fusarium poae]|uniref:hypothetical protein n=1 Tax=Fusarium poae TaxID=36050 RepID=UPI001CEBC252|nr:hypothetical protein FPOAC1_000256 [Fusarium poae]KAG8674291.1 hypothetical protein FPOAC1_000256 [Fusarium poae]